MTDQQWKSVRLRDVVTVRSGFAFKSEDWLPDGVPVVKIANVKDGRLEMGGCSFVSEAIAREASEFELVPGDILIAMTGYIGEVAKVRNEGRCLLNQRVGRFAIRDERVLDSDFLFLWLRCNDNKDTIANLGYGSAQPNISPTLIGSIELDLPPLPEQRAIARVLGGLDDKIELNRRMNRTLEDLARGVFRSWFVDFDPVLRPAPGPPSRPPSPPPVPPARRGGPASPAPRSAPAAPAPPHAPWPTRLTDSPLGPIPEGWRVGTVADLCTTQYGYTASATDDAVGPRMLRVTDMNKEPWVEWADVPHCRIDDDLLPRYALKLGDVLVSRMADPGKAAIVEEVLPEGAVFASYLIRLATRSIAASYYLFYYLRSDQYLDYAESVSGGTVQKNMNAQVITAAQMVIAPDAVADEFARLVRPWRAQIAANLQESRSLAALRDALLPQLLSGEIRLREADRAVDAALRSTGTSTPPDRPARPGAGTVHAGAKGRA